MLFGAGPNIRAVRPIAVAAVAYALSAHAALPSGDHYLCYKVKLNAASQRSVKSNKTLLDQFRTATCAVSHVLTVCNPAAKIDGTCGTGGCASGLTSCCSGNRAKSCTTNSDCTFTPSQPSVHQMEYRLKAVTGTPDFASTRLTIVDQLGVRDVQVMRPVSLLEPSLTVLGTGDPGRVDRMGVDRFECYLVTRPRGMSHVEPFASPQVTDEFGGPIVYNVGRPAKLCNPVDENAEDPGADRHLGHLVCYRVKRHDGQPAFAATVVSAKDTNSRTAVLDVVKPWEICLPAFKNPRCGDNTVDQPAEECDGTDDSACLARDLCRPNCRCAKPECGDGILTPSNGEQCDPPCAEAQCGTGQICNGSCQCAPDLGACACGTPRPTTFTFTTGVGVGQCGTLTTGSGSAPIACGGLYFGGGNDNVPLPLVIPDKGSSVTKVACCRGTTLNLAKTTSTETGTRKTCTAAGCFFGTPLPVPNPILPAASVCIINTFAEDATGTASCMTGDANILMPLNAENFLAGDLMPRRCSASTPGGLAGFTCVTDANCPGGTCVNDPAIQPCPVCNPDSGLCNGGPSEGTPCVAATSNLGKCSASGNLCRVGAPSDCSGTETCIPTNTYPVSHDCSPGRSDLGGLFIRFNLTSGTQSATAFSTGAGNGRTRVFCPTCRAAGGGPFKVPGEACLCDNRGSCARPCSTEVFPSCEQRSDGAFRSVGATGIQATGSPGGRILDRAEHATTLISVFCVPPTGNPLVDPNGDLPGPGAVALVGTARLLP